jgi:choline dehydrogenase-like flavoprotein
MSKNKGDEIPRREFLSKSAKVVAAVSATAALTKGSAAGREGGPGAGAPPPAVAADSKSAPPPACSSEKYDVVILGTGFGAAVAADTLLRKNKELKVLLLERGVWWFTTERPLPHDKKFGTNDDVMKGMPVQYWVKPDHHRGVKDMLSIVQPNRFKSPLQHPAASPLYRYNTFPNIDILTASAVGGGSTIYSNVTIEPHREGDSYPVMKDWPENTRLTADDYHRVDPSPQKNNPGAIQWMEDRRGPLNPVVTKAPLTESWLKGVGVQGANIYEKLANLDKDDDKRAFLYLGKSRALKDAARNGVAGWKNEPWAPLPLALLELRDDMVKADNNKLPTFCERQGRCFLGCMPGARHTINKMLIGKILAKYPNVTLENYADVSHIEFVDQGTYKVWLKDAKDSQKAAGCRVASKVIVSAGTLGSTEILLRSREGHQGKNFTGNLRLSNKLGHHFSSNGDFGGFTVPKNGGDPSVAQSLLPYPVFPTKGPINTSHVMFTKGDMQINVEDAAIPSMFAPLVRTALNVLGHTPSSGSGKK